MQCRESLQGWGCEAEGRGRGYSAVPKNYFPIRTSVWKVQSLIKDTILATVAVTPHPAHCRLPGTRLLSLSRDCAESSKGESSQLSEGIYLPLLRATGWRGY